MLAPKKQKFRKAHKGRVAPKAKAGTMLNFGMFGLKSVEQLRVTARQIEAARRAAVREMKRQGRFFIRIFPDLPVSKKPNEVRMGKGKGALDHWVALVQPGRLLFEIEGVSKQLAQESLELAAQKLPIKVKFVVRRDYDGQ